MKQGQMINRIVTGIRKHQTTTRQVAMSRVGCVIAVVSMLLMSPVCLAATVYDLKADWNPPNNPNGVWTYRGGNVVLGYLQDWDLAVAGAQPGYAQFAIGSNGNEDILPWWLEAPQNYLHLLGDAQEGDILVHSTDGLNGEPSNHGNHTGHANVLWTSPGTGSITIEGSVWAPRVVDDVNPEIRGNNWFLWNDSTSTLIASGLVNETDIYNRANPFNFSNGLSLNQSLSNIAVESGDIIRLQFEKIGNNGDFVGINLTITMVPLPSASLMGLGTMGILVLGRWLASQRRRSGH